MRDPYHPTMRRSWRSWSKVQLRRAASRAGDRRVRPLPEAAGPRFGFVVGCGHSGTTLLAAILGRHPHVWGIGHETEAFFPEVPLACTRRLVRSWQLLAQQAGHAAVVEKTPKHVLAAARIWRLLPRARILCTVRDGRDSVASLRARLGDLDAAIDRWLVDHTAVLRLRDDPRVRVIPYERLTAAPEATVGAACADLGLALEPAMLEPGASPFGSHVADAHLRWRAEQVAQPITPRLGRWQKELSEAELGRFWRRCQGVMAALGYAEEAGPAPSSSRS